MDKKHILVVEDEATYRHPLVKKLQVNEYIVLEANNGQKGLEIALKEKPDCILLDIRMPKMDGLEMLRRLRASNAWGKAVPVILLTNLADSEDVHEKVTAYEPSFFIDKSSSSLELLLEKIHEAISQAPGLE